MNIETDSSELNDEKFEKESDRCKAIVERWLPILGYGDWNVTLRFKRGEIPDDGDTDQDMTTTAHVGGDWRYLTAVVTVSCSATKGLDDDVLEEVLVHELVHPKLNPLRPLDVESPMKHWDNHNERVTTEIAKALVRAYNITPQEEIHGEEVADRDPGSGGT